MISGLIIFCSGSSLLRMLLVSIAAGEQRLQAAFLREVLADLRAERVRADEHQPVLAGAGVFVLRGHNLTGAGGQDRAAARAAVDLRADCTVADFTVDSVGEVHRVGRLGRAIASPLR